MDENSPPATPVKTERVNPTARSRSRSIVSNKSGQNPTPVPPPAVQYSPEAHPLTDPSLLALTQQQVAESPAPLPVAPAMVDPSLVGATPAVFAIDPALGGGPVVSDETTPSSTEPVARSASTPNVDMPHFPDANVVEEEEEMPDAEPTGSNEEAGGSGRGGARNSQAGDSDAELRRLAEENRTVPLDELARRVRNDENSPGAERTRQVYGLGWLMRNCERVPDTTVAVPRNRVYARYVGICANERIKPLNPASFGKLVRLMFPEIKTRRLGVRGQSKYHYCGIRLAGENSSPKVSHGSGSASGSEPPAHAAGDDHLSKLNNPILAQFGPYTPASVSPEAPSQSQLSSFMLNELCFSRNYDPENFQSPHDAFQIPDIDPYVPLGTDPDIAATLTAIYRSHCTSLVECVRYMRLKQFHHLFVSFHGTLTVPVQKLLAEPCVSPWIRESDWVMYKEMIRLLSPLALQVVPSPILTALRQLSSGLVSHIETTFSVQPQHVIKAKLGPAVIFCTLLDRLLRVNDAAHAAARFLGNPPDREQMIKDWQNHVDGDMIVDRELPCLAPEAKKILKTEIANLLQPTTSTTASSSSAASSSTANPESTESVLDRWTNFLIKLPARFRTTSPRHFNICLGAVASAALRDLTTNGAISFGSWWVVRCWIDEWMSWQAEKGGFLVHQAPPVPGEFKVAKDRNNRRSKSPNTLNAATMSKLDGILNNSTNGNHTSQPPPQRESTGRLLEDVGDDRVNRMVPPVYGK